jgi:imidazole glycerol-phosphate synthase subunit HisH
MNHVAIIDFGISNLTSIYNAFKFISVSAHIIKEPPSIESFSHIVLPGVGTYLQGMKNLQEKRFAEQITIHIDKGKPLLGICLGMQLLSTAGEEFGLSNGLDIIPGVVAKIELRNNLLRLPHVGWNNVYYNKESPLWKDIPENSSFYFIHSYAYTNDTDSSYVIGTTDYDHQIIVGLQKDNVFGVQFHPEKSQKVGLQLLANFAEIC